MLNRFQNLIKTSVSSSYSKNYTLPLIGFHNTSVLTGIHLFQSRNEEKISKSNMYVVLTASAVSSTECIGVDGHH